MRAVSRNSEERAIAGIDVVQGVKVSIGSISICETQVAGAWTERQKMFHGGSFLKLADDDV